MRKVLGEATTTAAIADSSREGRVDGVPLTIARQPGARLTLRLLPKVAMLADLAVMLFVAIAATLLRQSTGWFNTIGSHTFTMAGPVILAGWLVVIAAFGGYREQLFGAGTEEYRVLLNATLSTAGLTGVGCYLAHFDLSRSLFLLAFGFGSAMLVAERAMLRRALHRARRSGALCHDVVVAGTPTHIDEIGRILSRESWLGYRVLGAIVPPGLAEEETVGGIPVLGTTDHTLKVLESVSADVILVAGGALDGATRMRQLVWELEAHDVQVVVAPNVTDVSRERVRMRPVAGLPLVHIDPPRHVLAGRHAKRIFDAVLSAALLLAVAPVFLFIALTVKRHDRGPVFFRQIRIGRHGEPFWCFKFRTMEIDAEAKVAALQAAQGLSGSALWKMKEDPRITRPGHWLRRLSLDELPQLLNVVRGEMSLVGPRPQVPDEVATYDQFTRRRLHVRPGMTGLWQVSGRSDLTWDEAIRLDLYYVDNWSMAQDLSILGRTLGAVLNSRGAY